MDIRLGLKLSAPMEEPDHRPAVQVLAEVIRNSPIPVTIVALGPLTNLAELLAKHPDLIPRAAIVAMGGALNVPGNIRDMRLRSPNVTAEWNVFVDPYAAEQVLRSGVALTLVPLDATNQAPLTAEFAQKIKETATNPAGEFLKRLVQRISFLTRQGNFYLWGPLAAITAVHPEIMQFEERRLRVIQEAGPEQGRLVEDPQGSRVRVVTQVDREAFAEYYLNSR